MRSFFASKPCGQAAPAPHSPPSYGRRGRPVQTTVRLAATAILTVAVLLALPMSGSRAVAERPLRIVALGDSLIAGYGLRTAETFPARLQQALAAKGIAAEIVNAGVSGDTAADGLARLDWSVPEGTEAVILELGGNDALRGVDPAATRTALEGILKKLRERRIPVLLCGMLAPRNMGTDYAGAFDAMFPALAQTYNILLYPFFLEGVATDLALNQRDGVHPSAAGINVIVQRILPKVEELIAQAKSLRGS